MKEGDIKARLKKAEEEIEYEISQLEKELCGKVTLRVTYSVLSTKRRVRVSVEYEG